MIGTCIVFFIFTGNNFHSFKKRYQAQKKKKNRIHLIFIENISASLLRGFAELEDGWISPFNEYQYKVTRIRESWTASRRKCQVWGGDLVVHGVRDSGTRLYVRS